MRLKITPLLGQIEKKKLFDMNNPKLRGNSFTVSDALPKEPFFLDEVNIPIVTSGYLNDLITFQSTSDLGKHYCKHKLYPEYSPLTKLDKDIRANLENNVYAVFKTGLNRTVEIAFKMNSVSVVAKDLSVGEKTNGTLYSYEVIE